MAKADEPGFVDKHIEKVILAVCLLVLLYAVAQHGVSSKRTYEIAGEESVAPKEIDQILLRKAKRLDKRIQSQVPPVFETREDLTLLRTMQSNPIPGKEMALSFGFPSQLTMVEGIKGPEEAPSLAKLVEAMPVPDKPFSWFGPELMLREVEQFDGEIEVKIEEPATWRAVSAYPWRTLEMAWQRLLQKTVIPSRLVALGYELEIQVKQPDGTWKIAEAVRPVLLPLIDKDGEKIEAGALPEYTGKNGEWIREWLDLFGQEWSPYQLQPGYHEVWIRDEKNPSWEAHFPFDALSVYPEAETAAPKGQRPRANLADLLKARRAKARNIPRGRAKQPAYPTDMMMPPGMMPPGGVRQKTVRQKTTRKKSDDAPVEERPEVPAWEEQKNAGTVLMWFHTNTIQLGREYRCRFRLVFANPLLTHDKDLVEENKQEAYRPSVKTQWSEWSDPICVKREVDFFVTGAFPRGNQLTVTVFSKWMDQRLMYPVSKITPGERIRGSKKVKVMNLVTKEPMKDENGQDPVIEFDTGAVAIEFDFGRRIQTGAGVRNDVEMIYLDPEGRLRSRSMYRDRNDSKYKELEGEAREAASAFEPARPKKKPKKKIRKQKLLEPIPGMMPPGMGAPPAGDTRTRDQTNRNRRDRNR